MESEHSREATSCRSKTNVVIPSEAKRSRGTRGFYRAPQARVIASFSSGNACVTITAVILVREYLDERGRSPFADWFNDLNAPAAAKVTTALLRMEMGNFSNVKGVGSGVFEYRIDFGPGYRIYFGKDGDRLVILLGGGSKKRQQRDIAEAVRLWTGYKAGDREK